MTRPAKRRTQRIPEAQRHTERLALRMPVGVVACLDQLRGASTRSGYVAWLLSEAMAKLGLDA